MNLHYFITFSSRGSGVCRSLFLRTFMVMILFITGSNGIYAGEDLKATIGTPASKGSWNASTGTYNWTLGYDNLMPIFTITKGTLNTDYVALKFTTSKYTDKYRVCFMDGDALVATHTLESAGKITIKISELKVEKGKDLSQVDNIKFGGSSASGSITLDPNSIVLVGQLQNNTQRYDFSKFELTNQGGNVLSAAYDATEKALKVVTKEAWDNYFPLYKDLNGTTSTGVRLHAKGVKFRIVAKTSDNKTFQVNVPANDDYVTRHYKWEDFVLQSSTTKMTKDDVAKITEIGLAGDNAAGETGRVFYVQEFWLDDIADYDKTIPCYGDEGGHYDFGINSFVYTTAGATAVFEGSTLRDGNHNIILNKGNNLKLSLSSDVNKFTEVCLVFGAETTYNLTVADKPYTGTSTAVICPVNSSELTIQNNSSSAIYLSKIIYSSEKAGINEERTITVDGKTRKYWLYVPASVEGNANVPVIFSLHGRQNDGADPSKTDAPKFKDIADTKGVIIVYPQGRHATDKDYPNRTENGKVVAWNTGYAGNNYGWEATGQENADTKFIQALVDELKKNNFYGSTTVDPTRFYLCGFSMGGMMTYACAKVLNGTFAAYGSCGGFPLNEFHLNLATKQPVPFMHLHGDADGVVGINHLHTIIENLLFRNGCKLSQKQNNDDGWTTTTGNDMTRYEFKGVNGVPVTTVTFKDLGHWVHSSAPAYLWNFFSDKTVGQYDSDIEWKWDMTTINANITNSSSDSYYGWKHAIDGSDRSLTYGGGGKTTCSIKDCTSAKTDCDGNHNVYNSIQLTAGKHTLYAQMESTTGTSSVTLRNILTGAETVARKIEDNSGTAEATTYNVLYEFEVGEGAEYSLILKRSDTKSACTLLEIHRGAYKPGVKDQSQDNATIDITSGKLVELTFDKKDDKTGVVTAVDISPLTSGNGAELTSSDGNMKLYLKSRLGIKDGKIENKDKYIVKDKIFGYYFQNIPDADIYDRYGAADFLRVVFGTNNPLLGIGTTKGVHETGQITIGFWVNGDIAVNRGLAYDEPSMFYIAGDKYNGNNDEYNRHMFNITCNGGLDSYMVNYRSATDSTVCKFHTGPVSAFGNLCDITDNASFYKKNFYKDCNWHYITYQMYDGLKRYNMYVDGNPTELGGYAIPENNVNPLDYIAGLKSIVLGGANATNVKFAFDVAFAYDDIVIYNRVLSKREINEIIKKKKYTPSVWQFNANIGSNIFFSPEKLNASMWTNNGDGTYTLNTDFKTSTALTYDEIEEIPAFRGLNFLTNGTNKIKIDRNKGVLILSDGVKMIFSNMKKDNYVRMEYNHQVSDIWKGYQDPEKNMNQNMNQIVGIPSVNEGYDRAGFKITDAGEGKVNSITIPSDIEISAIEATDKYFAQILFEDKNTSKEISVVTNPQSADDLPSTVLKINNVPRALKGFSISYTSSSPHVASVDSEGNVTLHGVSGSTVITAELDNSERKYDCDIYDKYTFEPTNRIFASYEIVVSPKANASKVIDNKSYSVGETIYNEDQTIGVTLGGWTYNSGTYYGKTDSYSGKEMWAGQKFEKNPDRNGYKSDSRKTEENVFAEIFTEGEHTFSTNGSHPAKSEQLTTDATTGNYAAPDGNESVVNQTPWILPCRGSHIKIEPTDAGLISVYVMQEGCVSHAPSGGKEVGGVQYDEDEPIDVSVKKVYVADETGEIVKEVVADTKSKVAAQIWKDDGRARAEYFWGDSELAYNEATKTSFSNINDFNTQWSFLDNWPNPGMQQHVFKLGNDEYGHAIITKGIVRYTFNVLPGKTYYIFSNTAKLGLAGFTFESGKHAKYHKVKPDAKHDEWRATGDFEDYDLTVKNVTLNDGENYPTPAPTAKNANVTLNRTFYKNRWNAICLPYSINRRQIEKVFGNGTMVVLMKNIDTSNKKVMFIEHANQDIIAGYPYLIFPTDKAETNKKDDSVIDHITTRATFGEANSPLFSVGTDGNTYLAEQMQSDALVFKGTFKNNTPLTEGSYVVTNNGVLSRIPKDGMNIKPYRSYIYFNRVNTGAKAISLQSMNVNGFENDEDHTTGIENLLFESGILTHSADVYSIDGQLVRSKALNFNGLPKGVYIVNGKKYVKK